MANTVMPKPASQRQRRNRAPSAASLEAEPARKTALPGDHWHPNTLTWWEVIWSSPMSEEWVDADLPSLYRLARLDHDFWNADTPTDAVRLASEIRQQQMQFGLTPMSRRQLQWEVKRVKAEAPAAPPRARTHAERQSSLYILQDGRRTG